MTQEVRTGVWLISGVQVFQAAQSAISCSIPCLAWRVYRGWCCDEEQLLIGGWRLPRPRLHSQLLNLMVGPGEGSPRSVAAKRHHTSTPCPSSTKNPSPPNPERLCTWRSASRGK